MSKIILKQLTKYRLFFKKFIKTPQLKIKNKLILMCFFTSLTNKAFLLSQLFFLEIKKNNWFNLNINSNLYLINNKYCFFSFDTYKELYNFVFLTQSISMSPYIFIPLKILNGNSNLELPLSIFTLITKNILTKSFAIIFFWKQLILMLYSLIYNIFIIKNKNLNANINPIK